MERYEEYKDSGVEWIGKIPMGWEVKQIKRISTVRRGASPRPIADPKYFDTNGEWAWVRIADVSESKKYLKRTTQTLSELGSSLSVKIEPDSIFLSIAGTVGKPIITKIKCCIHDGFVYFPNLKIDPEYLYYIFATGLPYRGLGKWGTQLNLNTDTVGEIFIPIPRKEKMEAIVHYLNRKTKEIDELITQKERLLELYKEERTAIINHTVTKGIDPNVELKDSGVEWIGKIPVGWEVKKIRQFTNILTGATPKSTEERYWDGDIFWVTTDDLGKLKTKYIIDTKRKLSKDGFEKSATYLAPKESIVLSTRAPIGHLGILKVEACSNQGCKILVSNDKYNSEFVYYFLYAGKNFLSSLGTGTTFLELSTQSLKDNSVALPDIQEQTAIANFLDCKIAEIDAKIARTQHIIELQKEYRTTLISDVVTGKIKVSHLAEEAD